jgi:hypothetical protein
VRCLRLLLLLQLYFLVQVLEAALDRLGAKPVVHRMNPKAMPRQQLLGSLNLDTREWTDGVLTAAARKVSAMLPLACCRACPGPYLLCSLVLACHMHLQLPICVPLCYCRSLQSRPLSAAGLWQTATSTPSGSSPSTASWTTTGC